MGLLRWSFQWMGSVEYAFSAYRIAMWHFEQLPKYQGIPALSEKEKGLYYTTHECQGPFIRAPTLRRRLEHQVSQTLQIHSLVQDPQAFRD